MATTPASASLEMEAALGVAVRIPWRKVHAALRGASFAFVFAKPNEDYAVIDVETDGSTFFYDYDQNDNPGPGPFLTPITVTASLDLPPGFFIANTPLPSASALFASIFGILFFCIFPARYAALSSHADYYRSTPDQGRGQRDRAKKAPLTHLFGRVAMKTKIYSAVVVVAALAACPVKANSLAYAATGDDFFGMLDLTTGVFTELGNMGQRLAGFGVVERSALWKRISIQ